MQNRSALLKKLKKQLPQDRFNHTLGVEKVAVKLAQKHGVSVKAASLAALLHDYARKYPPNQLIKQARKHRLKISAAVLFEPKLVHAELSAKLAQQDFGLTTKPILSAIAKHTVGAPKMTALEKIIFLADHIEEGRRFTGVKALRHKAFIDLDTAVAASCSRTIGYLLSHSLPIDPRTIATRNYYLK